ncbi:MAG: type II secretion system minor pseudopilin GspK [Candidatus Tectomicrobia bacterium]|uniref:Type II secretion system minor pseudopilin GspK n=1 Tax=Tectimicrobiota bacterium TaxID=2528274 RepID=A0A932MMQ3_UNCTE|nr:type II secretion system minor pseudopilin GspK [Candidatus Tectomicrobia bacterium]
MIREARRRLGRQRGAALLMAIAATGLLAMIAAEIAGSALDETHLADAFRDDLRARWAVQAPVALVISALREEKEAFTSLGQKWARLDGTLTLGGIPVRFRVHDESAKINLNALASAAAARQEGTARALKKLFDRLKLDPALVDFLRDWIDPDADARAGGSETAYYQSLPRPYPVKNGTLDSLSELRLVRGYTPKVLRALGFPDRGEAPDLGLSGRLTLYSGETVNVNTAGRDVLLSLPDLPENAVEDLVARRNAEPIRELADLKKLSGMTDALYNKVAPMLGVESRFFSVESETEGGRMRKRLLAVLKREKEQVSIVYWRML